MWREIKCKCNKIIIGQDYNSHLKNHCSKRVVNCRHSKCTMRIVAGNRQQHEQTDCQQRWISCMFKDISRTTELGPDVSEIQEQSNEYKMGGSVGNDEIYAIVESLAVALKAKEIEDLDSRVFRVVGCGSKVRLSEMENHWIHHCKSREIVCGSGCGVTFCYGATHYHKTKTCSKREVMCRLGCMKKTMAEEQQQHEERICKFRQVYCSLGCNTVLIEYKRAKHEHEDCHLRFLDCTNNCGATMRYEDLKYHLSDQCENREYKPEQANYECKRCSMENSKEQMLSEYGEDVFDWKCSVCKLPAYVKGQSVAGAKKGSGKKDGGGGLSTKLF